MDLENTLTKYSKSNMYPFHMPGHKRQIENSINPYMIDMTEVDGVDDLHDPEGVIKWEQSRIAKLYCSDESIILVGGSTSGNLAAVYAAVCEGDKVIIQRNSHKSVYNAVTLRHCKVNYIYPKINDIGIYNAVTPKEVENALAENPDTKAIVITSPTYEGYHCQIKEIAKICHEREIVLIVDQAHGAHLGFSEEFKNRASEFADITIQSLHKTMPALTQTAVMHIKGNRVDRRRIREAVDIFETSSPSYVLMNSVSKCISLVEREEDLFAKYVDNLTVFYDRCEQLEKLKIVSSDSEKKDPGKIIISTANTVITGIELAAILREKYQIETEMASFGYVIAMTSILDSKEGFERLESALLEIDKTLDYGKVEIPNIDVQPAKEIELFEAKSGLERVLKDEESVNYISAGMICIYPPGSPIIVPGERITEETIELINTAREKGLHVTGVQDNMVCVVN